MDNIEAMLLWQLNDAIFYNSKKIRAHLLADKNCNLDHLNSKVPRPLLVAMRTGNMEIVEDVLKAGASVNARGPMHECYKTAETWPALRNGTLSAIEYACHLDNTAMLRLIASYDKDKNRNGTSLHAVINLTRSYLLYFHVNAVRRFVLPTFVRVIIDEGVNVNAPDQHGDLPLNYLLREVMITLNSVRYIDSKNNYCQMIVDAVRILLDAGADPNAPECSNQMKPLQILLDIIIFYCAEKIEFSRFLSGNELGMILEIVVLLLEHKTHIPSDFMNSFFDGIRSLLTNSFDEALSGVNSNNLTVLELNELVDGLVEILRLLLLSGGLFDMATCSTYARKRFGHALIAIMNYCSTSSVPLQNLRDLLTDHLSSSVLYQLRIGMINKEFDDRLITLNSEKADEFLCENNAPRSLQDTARDTIIRCLSGERLLLSNGQEVLSSLKIPSSLHKYILLQK